MTAALHSPLVEMVAKAIYRQDRMVVTGIFDGKLERDKVLSWEECKRHLPGAANVALDAAQAAIDACHADEMTSTIKKLIAVFPSERHGLDTHVNPVVIAEAQALLAKLEGPSPPPTGLGYCPICGAPGLSREKRPFGDDLCEAGHRYPSSNALPSELEGRS